MRLKRRGRASLLLLGLLAAVAGLTGCASESSGGANPTILIGVVLLVAVSLGVGLWVSRLVKGQSVNYIVAGRGLILPLAAATLMAQ